jgi:hypothetical protein
MQAVEAIARGCGAPFLLAEATEETTAAEQSAAGQ